MENGMDQLDYEEARRKHIRVFGDFANPPSVRDLEYNYSESKTIHDEQISKIDHWLELYEAKNINRGSNKSRTRPKTIKKMAKWSYPSIEEPVLAKPSLFALEPRTFEDKTPCLLNEIIINKQVESDIDFVKFVNESTRVLVTQGTCIVKIGWKRKYENIKKIVPIYQEQIQLDPQSGMPVFDQTGAMVTEQVKVGTEIKIEEEMTHNHPTIEVCNYKKVMIDPTAKGDISNAQFIIYEYETNLSNLKKDGRYKNLELIDFAYNKMLDEDNEDVNQFNFKDKARKRLFVREYWGYWDINNTGKTEMIVVTYVGNIVIDLEVNPLPFNELPFEICQFEPIFESNYGEPDAEIIKENQENIGAITRAMIDIMAKSASGQEARPKGWLDIVNKRKYDNGEDYEYDPMVHPREALHMHTPGEIPATIWNFVQYQENDTYEMVGKKPFSIGKTGSSTTATAVRSSLDATAKRELGILRRYTSMLKKIAFKMIEMNRLFLTDGQIFKITNDKYLSVNRDHLYGKFDIKIDISTPEDNENKINKKSFMLQTLGNTIPFDITKEMMADIAKLENDPVAEKRIREYEPQPDPIEEKKKELELELLQAQIDMYRSSVNENGSDAQLNIAKIQEVEAKAQKLKAEADNLDLNFIHDSEGTKHIRDLEKGQQQANKDIDLKLLDAKLNKNNKDRK